MPKGLSVSSRVLWIAFLISSTVSSTVVTISVEPALVPSTPSPPAFDTAATSSGDVIHAIGAWITGFVIPKISHTLFI